VSVLNVLDPLFQIKFGLDVARALGTDPARVRVLPSIAGSASGNAAGLVQFDLPPMWAGNGLPGSTIQTPRQLEDAFVRQLRNFASSFLSTGDGTLFNPSIRHVAPVVRYHCLLPSDHVCRRVFVNTLSLQISGQEHPMADGVEPQFFIVPRFDISARVSLWLLRHWRRRGTDWLDQCITHCRGLW
jgi:hypothetical protein